MTWKRTLMLKKIFNRSIVTAQYSDFCSQKFQGIGDDISVPTRFQGRSNLSLQNQNTFQTFYYDFWHDFRVIFDNIHTFYVCRLCVIHSFQLTNNTFQMEGWMLLSTTMKFIHNINGLHERDLRIPNAYCTSCFEALLTKANTVTN